MVGVTNIPFAGQGLGLGLEAFGAFEQYSAAKKQAGISQQEVGVEEQQDSVRKQAMELQYKRQSMQGLRQAQQARSMAVANATNQGAGSGSPQSSGLVGGLAGIYLGVSLIAIYDYVIHAFKYLQARFYL